MEAALTHWKKLQNPDYLGAYSLQPGEEPIYTIRSVGLEMVSGTDGKKDECTVAHFAEKVKPMILNATNCKTITKMYGTPYIEDWVGKKIQIYSTTIKAFGEEVEALRIRPKPPTLQRPVMDESYKGWGDALAAVKAGETTVDYLKTKYLLPPQAEKIMLEAASCQTQDI